MPFDRDFEKTPGRVQRLLVRRTRVALSAIVVLSFFVGIVLFGAGPPFTEFLPTYRTAIDLKSPSVLFSNADPLWKARASSVRSAFISAYQAYQREAYPHDELQPITNGFKDE